MSKLDVFIWLTVKCYGEVSTKRFKENAWQTKVQKRFIYWERKESMEQGNELKWPLL